MRKKLWTLVLCVLMLASLGATAAFAETTYTVRFVSAAGAFTAVEETVAENGKATKIPDWSMDYFSLSWTDESGTEVDPLEVVVTKDTTFTAKWTEKPSAFTDFDSKASDKNGFMTPTMRQYTDSEGGKSALIGAAVAPSVQPDGATETVVSAAILNLTKLDVNKPIVIRFTQQPAKEESTPGYWNTTKGCWTLFTFFESSDQAMLAGNSAWNGTYGSKLTFWSGTMLESNSDYGTYGEYTNKLTLGADASPLFKYCDDNWAQGYNELILYFSEDGSSNYAALNGVKFSSLSGKKQSDFAGGYAYFMYASSANVCARFLEIGNSNETEHTVTFAAPDCDGFLMAPLTVPVGGKLTKPTDPSMELYTFEGWYTDEACTQAYDFNSIVIGDLTLYAKMTPEGHLTEITFSSPTGKVASVTKSYLAGSKLTVPSSFSRVGFIPTFYREDGVTVFDPETEDVPEVDKLTLTAKWTEIMPDFTGSDGKKFDPTAMDANGFTTAKTGVTYTDADGNALAGLGSSFGNYQNFTSVVESDGTYFVIPGSGSMLNLKKLDVTQEIVIRYTQQPAKAENTEGYWNGQGGGFSLFTLFDSIEMAMRAGSNAWNPANGATAIFWSGTALSGERERYTNKFTIGEDVSETFKYCNDNWNKGMNELVIYISRDGSENYAKLNGEKFSSLSGMKQSDFADGHCYFYYMSAATVYNKIGVSQNKVEASVTYRNGEETVKTEVVRVGEKLTPPTMTAPSGKIFRGWYLDTEGIRKFDSETMTVSEDMTLYALFKEESETFYTVIFDTDGRFPQVIFELKEGEKIPVTLVPEFTSGAFRASWYNAQDENREEFDFDTAVTGDLVLRVLWKEDPVNLWFKVGDVVQDGTNGTEEMKYPAKGDANGWDTASTSYNDKAKTSWVDAEGNEVINYVYGCSNFDQSFRTADDYTEFVLGFVGGISNLKRIDVTKDFTLRYYIANWGYQGQGRVTVSIFDNLLSSLKQNNSEELRDSKIMLRTATVEKPETGEQDPLYSKWADVRNDTEPVVYTYRENTFYELKFHIGTGKDGDASWAKIGDTMISDLGGITQTDFVGGYCYLHIGTYLGSMQFRALISQDFDFAVDNTAEHGTLTADKTGTVGFREKITLTATPDAGYVLKSVRVGETLLEAESDGTVVYYKGWGDETAVAEFAKAVKVTFVVNGGSTVEERVTYEGGVFSKPINPKKEGYKFGGWFTDEACTNKYDWKTVATGDLTLYALWTPLTEEPEKTGCGCGAMTTAGGIGGGAALVGLVALIPFAIGKKRKN